MHWAAMQLRKKKKRLWTTYCQTHNLLDNIRFTRCQNQLRKLTRNLQREYETRLAADMKQACLVSWHSGAISGLDWKSEVESRIFSDENDTWILDNQAKANILISTSTIFTDEENEQPPQMEISFQGQAIKYVDVFPENIKSKSISLKPSSSMETYDIPLPPGSSMNLQPCYPFHWDCYFGNLLTLESSQWTGWQAT